MDLQPLPNFAQRGQLKIFQSVCDEFIYAVSHGTWKSLSQDASIKASSQPQDVANRIRLFRECCDTFEEHVLKNCKTLEREYAL